MHALKTETLTIRLCPATKVARRQAAEQQHRSLSNMREAMIRDYHGRQLALKANQQGWIHDGSTD
ncbi:hypothetical protein CCR95_16970 [Thiocystis minor]|uniref:hypothetical protein n=1 Tax=Thiocystis minor TaxID=61597 RepID=UPI00191289D0|nr:hypothetical protein [Thiocystis minor]MBK5965725.1 hypothetical protein [Thiocystis minor]